MRWTNLMGGRVVSAVLAVLLALSVTGCALMPASPTSVPSGEGKLPEAGETITPPPQSAEPKGEDSSVAQGSTTPTKNPEAASGQVDAEVQMLYERFTAYADFQTFWYEGGNAQAAADQVTTYEEREYCRYETEEVKSFEDFTAAALALMTQEQFDLLQGRVPYIDYQGALYGPHSSGTGDRSGFAGYECEAVKLSEQEFELKAGHYYYATAFDSGADSEKRVLVGETTCRFFLSDGLWKVSSTEYAAANSAAG